MIIVLGDIHAKNKEPFISSIHKTFEWIRTQFGTNITLIQLGDLYDTSSPHNEIEFEIIAELLTFKQVFVLTGNHDHSKIKGNALLSLAHHPSITIINNETRVQMEGLNLLLLPYIYGNMKEHYESMEGTFDYILTHITPLECAFGDEGVDLKLKGTYIHGHTHIQKQFIDKYKNSHIVLGVPLPTRHGEQNQEFSVLKIDDTGSELVSVPQFFTYETIEYGQEPSFVNNILNVTKAPSIQSVFEKYKSFFIREEGIEIEYADLNSSEKSQFEQGSLKDKFNIFCIDNNIDEKLKNFCITYL